VALARRFELAPRLAARQGRERLEAELLPLPDGAGAAQALHRDRLAAAATGLRLTEVVRDVAVVAATLDLPLVLLKLAALEAAGRVPAGGRPACDVDLLAPERGAADLQRALVARGYRESPLPAPEHQLPALVHPDGGALEIHRLLPGVRLDGGDSATQEDLARAGLLVPVLKLPGRCAVPTREVAAAHALVHGLGQHGWWPNSYSLLKMVGDLIDLGLAEPEVAQAIAPWTARDVTTGELAAAHRLCAALARGDDPAALLSGTAGASDLLHHALAGRLDAAYAASLRLGLFRAQPSDRPERRRLARSLAGTLFLTRAQVDAIYGPPRHRGGYLARQLLRPFDLALRLLRYAAAGRAARRP